MVTTVVKWGNSQGIRIPKTFLQNIQISENDPVDVILEKEKIIIRKRNIKNHKTTKERLMEFYGHKYQPYSENTDGAVKKSSRNSSPVSGKKRKPQKETDWGKPVGKEIW